MINAALHGIVEEEEHCALGFVEAKLNREAGVFELARQIGQGLIEYVFGIHGATIVAVRVLMCRESGTREAKFPEQSVDAREGRMPIGIRPSLTSC